MKFEDVVKINPGNLRSCVRMVYGNYKWPYFVSLSTTTKIIDFPHDMGKPSMKFIETSTQTLVGLNKGYSRPEGIVVFVLCLWHTS